MSIQNDKVNERDFIDFLLRLFFYKKTFIAFLILFVGLGVFYNIYYNASYKFKVNVHVIDKSTLSPIINFMNEIQDDNFYKTDSSYAVTSNISSFIVYKDFKFEICGLLKTSIVDHNFFNNMADIYMKSSDVRMSLDRDQVAKDFRAMICIKPAGELCTSYRMSGDLEKLNFLHSEFLMIVNRYISKEIKLRMEILNNVKISSLDLIISSFKQEDENEEYFRLKNKREILKKRIIPKTNFNFFKYNLYEVRKTMGSIFIYVFSIFLAVFSYVVFVLMSDLREQLKLRQ